MKVGHGAAYAPSVSTPFERLTLKLKLGISLFAGLLLINTLCKSQTFDSSLSIHTQGQLSAIMGAGASGGMRAGVRYNMSDRSSVELTYGFVPFIEFAGERDEIIGSAYNYYLKSSHIATGFISLLLSYNRIETTSGNFKNDLFIISPTFGVDVFSESSLGFSIRIGFDKGIGSASTDNIGFNFDIGISYRVL